MATISPKLEIPLEYQIKLDNKELFRSGGVLRRTTNGTIALILKDADIEGTQENQVINLVTDTGKTNSILDLIKNHKIASVLGIVGVTMAVGVGVYLYIGKKHSKKKHAEDIERVTRFQSALSEYIKSAISGELSENKITDLLDALAILEENHGTDRIWLDFSVGELHDLVECIIRYTKVLAEANSVVFDNALSDNSCTVVNLRHHLEAQKEIFKKEA